VGVPIPTVTTSGTTLPVSTTAEEQPVGGVASLVPAVSLIAIGVLLATHFQH
jgi:hypothetical protein